MIRFIFVSLVLIFSCSYCAFSNHNKESVKIILDTDMGSDCDDVGALAILNEYANIGKVEILGVIYSSGAIPYGVGVIDAVNIYYGNNDIPIGANYDRAVGDPIDKMQAEKLSKDTAAFKNRFIANTDVPEQTQLLRKLISAQEDNSVVYVTIGHTKGIYDFLVSKPDVISDLSGYELAAKKIKKWIALGALNAKNKEGQYVKDWNLYFNNTASYTKYVVDNFPKPIYFVSGGAKVMTGKSLQDTPAGNIVRTAYRDWLWNIERKTLSDQRPSWDLATVYFAVEGVGQYFDEVNRGYLDFDIEKGCRWINQDTASNQFFVSQKSGTDSGFANYLNSLLAKRSKKLQQ